MHIDIITLAMYLIILVIALTIHEFCHAWAGHLLGDVTAKDHGRLTLNPLAHIDPLTTLLLPLGLIMLGSPVVFGAARPVPFNPYAVRYDKWGVVLVAISGPLSNLLMAVVVGLYLRFVPISGVYGQFLLQFVVVNLAFFIFNMIPFPPLDGSRVLYAIAPAPVRDVMDKIENYGIVVVFVFILFLFPLITPFITASVQFLLNLIVGGSVSL
ncbi:MAG: site-2 protease family protein [Candidatus Saccharibacteria bacterium]